MTNEIPVKEGDELKLMIEAMGSKGDGIAKLDGYTIFVPEAKLNETVNVRVYRTFQKFAFAEIINKEEN